MYRLVDWRPLDESDGCPPRRADHRLLPGLCGPFHGRAGGKCLCLQSTLAFIIMTKELKSCSRLQFLYMCLVGTFPFNSFLAGLLCTIGFFVLTGMPTTPPSDYELVPVKAYHVFILFLLSIGCYQLARYNSGVSFRQALCHWHAQSPFALHVHSVGCLFQCLPASYDIACTLMLLCSLLPHASGP